ARPPLSLPVFKSRDPASPPATLTPRPPEIPPAPRRPPSPAPAPRPAPRNPAAGNPAATLLRPPAPPKAPRFPNPPEVPKAVPKPLLLGAAVASPAWPSDGLFPAFKLPSPGLLNPAVWVV